MHGPAAVLWLVAGTLRVPATKHERRQIMPAKYPVVVFAPNGGTTFVVRLSETEVSRSLPTPMPATRADGRLAAAWRWGGHQIDDRARTVHFTFVNRLSNECWMADVAFAEPCPPTGVNS
jgi:hypothetical protein